MITIQDNKHNIKINDLGFVVEWSASPLVSESYPIYLVIFEEYSRINPFCQPLDTSSPLTIKTLSVTHLVYTKKIGTFSFEHEISITEEGIDWLVRFDSSCTNHSIGLALPFPNNWYDFSQQSIKENVANYSSFLHGALYPDQKVLDIPCICADGMSVFGNIKSSYQFFRYQDKAPWARVTTSTSSLSDTVEFCIRNNVEHPQDAYLSKFPDADEFINKWKSQFKELGTYFGIDIVCQQSGMSLNKGDVTYVSKICPDNKDLERYYPILKRELNKYPESFFTDLNITCIQLVTDLWIQTDQETQKIDGKLWADGKLGIVIDMLSPVGIVHHEIFHGIQQKKKFYDVPGEMTQFSDSIQITGVSEFLAELFALLMTNPGKAYDPKSGIDTEQIEYLKKGVEEFVSFPSLSSQVEHRTIFAITPSGVQEIEFGDICESATRYTHLRS